MKCYDRMILAFLLIWFETLVALPEDEVEYAEWESRMLAAVENQKNQPSDQAIPKLGKWLLQLNSASNIEKGDRPVFRAAQSAILSIPGHSEYYANRLNEIYEEALAQAKQYNWSHLSVGHERGFCFETMSHLPSPETVRVLGEMLDDMRSLDLSGSQPKDWTLNKHPRFPAAWLAASTLTNFELSGAPMQRFAEISREDMNRMTAEEYYNTNIEPWRLWYAQVKAGTRTFRFKDDPQEYNLDGPVQVAAVTTSPRKGVAESAIPAESGRAFPWPLIGSLLALAAAVGWYSLRRKSFVR